MRNGVRNSEGACLILFSFDNHLLCVTFKNRTKTFWKQTWTWRESSMKWTLRSRLVRVIEGHGQEKFNLAPIGLRVPMWLSLTFFGWKQNWTWLEYESNIQNEIGQCQGQVKLILPTIGLKLGENKPEYNGSRKWNYGRDWSRSSKVTVKSNFIWLQSGPNLVK